jgi:cytochrome c553
MIGPPSPTVPRRQLRWPRPTARVALGTFLGVVGGCAPEAPAEDVGTEDARGTAAVQSVSGHDALPWAFVLNDPAEGGAPAPDPDEVVTVPGSGLSLRRGDIALAQGPPDWHPDGHPPMPPVVARGGGGDVMACGYCHLPNGQGKPENAGLAGQPQVYLEQQMADWRAGLRRTGEPRMVPPSLMTRIGAATSPEQAREAAAYFASMDFRPWIRVVEVDSVPRTRFAGWIHEVVDEGEPEPLGLRVVETPEDLARTKLRDDASGFVAYVPPGSVDRGRALVERGGADGVPCTACHGADLRGLGPMPALAGRSPSYLARQLWDFRQGNRAGAWSALMAGAVADLTEAQIVDIVAYAASLQP